jgi:hypothetical protein
MSCVSGVLLVCSACGGAQGEATEPPPPPNPSPQSNDAKAALRDSGSAASIALAFWRYVGKGALPAAHGLYDEEVAATVGEDLAGALAQQQATAAASFLRIYDVESAGGGMVVLAETLPENGPKMQWSFFLKRTEARWRIVYDTFTAAALSYYVQQEVQRRIDPNAKSPSPGALNAADRALAEFRKAALGAAGGKLPGTISERSEYKEPDVRVA